jgi:acyl-CoA thioesterase
MQPADLMKDTAVTGLPAAPGWYTAELPAHWNYLSPSGGALMTVALRAMQAEVPDLLPTSATALFCSPVPDGPLEIRVEILRRGRAAAQLRAALSSTRLPGPGLEVSATFTRTRRGPEGTFVRMPADISGPETARPLFPPGEGPFAFFRNYDIRTALGHAPGGEWGPQQPRHARWYRALVPQRLADGRLDPLSLPPIADTMPSALVQALGPGHPRFYAPSLDLTVHFLTDTRAEWVCAHSTCRHASRGYATADVEIWDPDGNLLAFGTQMMFLRNVPGT